MAPVSLLTGASGFVGGRIALRLSYFGHTIRAIVRRRGSAPSGLGVEESVYNIVDGHVTWREFTDEIRGWFGTPPLETAPPEEGPGWSGRIDASRARGELSYAPRRTYRDGMDEARRYWREQHAAA